MISHFHHPVSGAAQFKTRMASEKLLRAQKLCMIIVPFMLVFFITGCSDSNVELIRSGKLASYGTTPIGKVFDAAFDEGTWTTYKKPNGRPFVLFRGRISKKLQSKAIKSTIKSLETPIGLAFAVELRNKAINYFGVDRSSSLISHIGCSVEEHNISCNRNGVLSDSEDNSNIKKAKEIILLMYLKEKYWIPGDDVEILWSVNPYDKSFEVVLMGSNSWKGSSNSGVLSIIFE
ncbi:hypothetical protein JCM17960_08610 [Magnetospira thiophila]